MPSRRPPVSQSITARTPSREDLLEENRRLRAELDEFRADIFARRGNKIRKAFDESTVFVSERELADYYLPYSRKEITRLRRDEKIRPVNSQPNGRTFLYNLNDVKAALYGGRPPPDRKLLEIDLDRVMAV